MVCGKSMVYLESSIPREDILRMGHLISHYLVVSLDSCIRFILAGHIGCFIYRISYVRPWAWYCIIGANRIGANRIGWSWSLSPQSTSLVDRLGDNTVGGRDYRLLFWDQTDIDIPDRWAKNRAVRHGDGIRIFLLWPEGLYQNLILIIITHQMDESELLCGYTVLAPTIPTLHHSPAITVRSHSDLLDIFWRHEHNITE